MSGFGRRAILRGAAALGVAPVASAIAEKAAASNYAHEAVTTGGFLGKGISPVPTPDHIKALYAKMEERRHPNMQLELTTMASMKSWSPVARLIYQQQKEREFYEWRNTIEREISAAWEKLRDPVGNLLRGTSAPPEPTHPLPAPGYSHR